MGGHVSISTCNSTCAGRRYSRGRRDHRRHRHRQAVAPQIGVRRLVLDRRGVWLAGPATRAVPSDEINLLEALHVEISQDSRR